jgi:hypothetical protein
MKLIGVSNKYTATLILPIENIYSKYTHLREIINILVINWPIRINDSVISLPLMPMWLRT